MGVRLMVEILDHWQDAGLTVGERSDLLVLAENANDGTRLTFGPVHAEYILRRAGKGANGWKNAIGKLLAKKVLTVHTPGRIKQAAVYRLEPLCSEPRHDGHKGMCVRPSQEERVISQVTHHEEEGHFSGDPMGHPSGDPLGEGGHLTGAKRVTSQVTPTPLNPSFKISSTTPSSSPAEPASTEPTTEPDVTTGGGGDLSPSRPLAEEVAAALCAGQPVHRQLRETLTLRLAAALDAGWTMDGLAVYLHLADGFEGSRAAVCSWRLGVERIPAPEPLTALPAVVAPSGTWQEAVARAKARLGGGGPRPGTDTTVAGWGEVGRQLAAEKYQPYSNDPWSQPADPVEAAGVPWCGDVGCDETTRLRPALNPLDKPSPCTCHPAMQWR